MHSGHYTGHLNGTVSLPARSVTDKEKGVHRDIFKGLKLFPHIKFLKHVQSLVMKIRKTICGLGTGIG